MIFKSGYLLAVLTASIVMTACSGPASNAPAGNANASSSARDAKPVARAPTADALLALDKQATQAYVRGDGNFFEHLLSDKLVMQQGGSRLSKSDVIKMISGVKCEVKEGWALTEPKMLKIDDDAYVLSYKSDMDGNCTTNGKTEKLPSPVRAATVWIRDGEEWQVAFHGENPIIEPAAAAATDTKDTPAKHDMAAANVNSAAAPTPAKPTADPITNALMKAENSIWDAWMAKDAKKLEDLTAGDIAFVDIFGTYAANKAAAIKAWTSALCDVTSFTLTNGVGTSITPKVAILTLTGTLDGTCGGKDIGGQTIHGNTVYVKDGDAWKWVFGFNSPT